MPDADTAACRAPNTLSVRTPESTTARPLAAGNLTFQLLDINELAFDRTFDLVFSSATLHWIKNHRTLLRRVRELLNPGGLVRFNFAGDGNCATLNAVAREVMAEAPFAALFADFAWPWYMPPVDEYRVLAEEAGFCDVEVWGENADRHFADAANAVDGAILLEGALKEPRS